jgi:hypothetical protein
MKTQKPVPAIIRMRLKDRRYMGDDFLGISTVMLDDGLILSEPRELRRDPRNPEVLELICTFVDQDSARIWLTFPKVKKYCRPKFRKLLKEKPRLVRYRNVIYDYDKNRVCACKDWPSFLLSPDPLGHFSSVVCGECLTPIPPYKLPDDLMVTSWENIYEHVYLIWLESRTLESWAEAQLGDYNSDLNREARRILGRLRKFRPVPAYYMIWSEEYSKEMPCPNCGRKGRKSPWEKPERVCGVCKLGFGY